MVITLRLLPWHGRLALDCACRVLYSWQPSYPHHWENRFCAPSFCTFSIFAPKIMTLFRNAKIWPFSESHGFPSDSLLNDRLRVASIICEEALEKCIHIHNNEERIRLVLMYHPLSLHIIIMSETTTAAIFRALPVKTTSIYWLLRVLKA